MENNFIEEVSKDVSESSEFKDSYNKLIYDIGTRTLLQNADFTSNEIEQTTLPLEGLLETGILFARSSNVVLWEYALRIALYAATWSKDSFHTPAFMVLDILSNQPAIKLAKLKNSNFNGIEYSCPLSFSLEHLKRKMQYSISVSEQEEVHCSPFQKDFWDIAQFESLQPIAISAPTSAGKSYIVRKWIKKNLRLHNNDEINVALIVPTRALIQQFENDMREEFANSRLQVNIITMPFAVPDLFASPKHIYIFTQERMQVFLGKNPNKSFDILFVDEAHKIGDKTRGVLLEGVIEAITNRNINTKVIFAAPHVENLKDIFINSKPLLSKAQAVNQNFFYITRDTENKNIYSVEILSPFKKIAIGHLETNTEETARIKEVGYKKLAILTYKIGKDDYGNFIYANEGSQAEKITEILYEREEEITEKEKLYEINKLIELCEDIVSKDFYLNVLLKKGIAFHYGSMPQEIRVAIERLFNKRIIKYLVCTSTLLEGVNLSCKNLFIRKPEKGKNQPMEDGDLFNLVGRAGRLGKEFFGNIYYLDWNEAPTTSKSLKVQRSIARVLETDFINLLRAFNVGVSHSDDETTIATTGYLFTYFSIHKTIKTCPEIKNICSDEKQEQLEQALIEYDKQISIPREILIRHPTTHHRAMEKLLKYFEDQYKTDINILSTLLFNLKAEKLSGEFIKVLKIMDPLFNMQKTPKEINYAGTISALWMQMHNIPAMINMRQKTYKEESLNKTIREVFKGVDSIARYEVPKFLGIYLDVFYYFLKTINKQDLIDETEDLAMYLEYGVMNKTQAAMIKLGFSRTAIFKILDIYNENLPTDLDTEKTLSWLKREVSSIIQSDKIPTLIKEEISKTIGYYKDI